MKTLAQVIFETVKPNRTFEEHRQVLIDSGAFNVATLDSPVTVEVEDRRRKTAPSITPRSVNWKGHEVIRGSLKKNTHVSEVVQFLVKVIYERIEKQGGELNVELVEEWKDKVEPYLDELSTKDAVEVSLEWLKKAANLGEFGSKAMTAYLNTKSRNSKSEDIEEESQKSDSYFPEDDV